MLENLTSLPFLISLAAMIVGAIGLWLTNRNHVWLWRVLYNTLGSIHYLLIGNYAQASLQIFSTTRLLIAKIFHGNKKIAYGLIIIGFMIFFATFKVWYNIFSLIVFITGTLAFFFYDKIQMRSMLLIGASSSATIAIIAGSWPIAAFELLSVVLHIRAILWHKKYDELSFFDEVKSLHHVFQK